ncbi:MAG: hypothetical protein Q8O83_04315 [bacterium]|nr:hypothetical protein [bacterium]
MANTQTTSPEYDEQERLDPEETIRAIENIKNSYPRAINLLEQLPFYFIAVFADLVLDIIFPLLTAVLAATVIGAPIAVAIEVLGDVIDVGMAGILIIWVLVTAFLDYGHTKSPAHKAIVFRKTVIQIAIITGGTVIEFIPFVEIVPSWLGSVNRVVHYQHDARKKVEHLYKKTIAKLKKQAWLS